MKLRSVVGGITALAMLGAQLHATPSFAQSPTSLRVQQAAINNAAINEAFAQFPQGGDALAKRISDLVVEIPDRATYLVRYVRTAGVSHAQKIAAEQGLAAALQRLGVKAADMPPMVTKGPIAVAAEPDYSYLALLAAALVGAGIACAVDFCRPTGGGGPVSGF